MIYVANPITLIDGLLVVKSMLTILVDNMLMELIPGYICIGLLIACIGAVLHDCIEEKPTDYDPIDVPQMVRDEELNI